MAPFIGGSFSESNIARLTFNPSEKDGDTREKLDQEASKWKFLKLAFEMHGEKV